MTAAKMDQNNRNPRISITPEQRLDAGDVPDDRNRGVGK